MFPEAVHPSPSRVAYISGLAVTTRDLVHHSCLILRWNRAFYLSQEAPECFVWFETGSDAEGSQHTSDVWFTVPSGSVLACCWHIGWGTVRIWSGYPLFVRNSLTCCSSSVLLSAIVQRRSALWYNIRTTATLCARG